MSQRKHTQTIPRTESFIAEQKLNYTCWQDLVCMAQALIKSQNGVHITVSLFFRQSSLLYQEIYKKTREIEKLKHEKCPALITETNKMEKNVNNNDY